MEELLEAALAEIRVGSADTPAPYLLELQGRDTEEIFQRAVELSRSDDEDERDLGVMIVRELGPQDDTGRRPFSERAIPHLVRLLECADDPQWERILLQALAFNGARETLAQFTSRANHRDVGVRTTVAFQLPSVLNPVQPEESAIRALESLCHDADADVRYYALHALMEEDLPVEPQRARDAVRHLMRDGDEQIRALARFHLSPPFADSTPT